MVQVDRLRASSARALLQLMFAALVPVAPQLMIRWRTGYPHIGKTSQHLTPDNRFKLCRGCRISKPTAQSIDAKSFAGQPLGHR